ncbi:MAG: stage III sporulation AC/AD family protein [Acetobacter sp.]|nr:stage III sporulation AC/AD family protein [Bacteroides sp.]MCM1340598.1 stage III sporulation AC/AD family protein [Acetobacter sp.]MCM1433338.1 stage III sporulation AC/AD family protein [Clostridiales bacterium]
MIKIFGIVIIALITIVLLKDIKKEYSILITIASVIFLFTFTANDLFEIVKELTDLTDSIENLGNYIGLMVKILGISLLAQFTSDLCRDSGENALASQTEIISKIIILVMTMPLLKTMITVVTGMLK